jgi:CheY-like chemotaxis protein
VKKVAVLVDDDRDDLDLLSECIREVDDTVDCICFTDPEEAINYFNSRISRVPTYIFLDVNMPKVTGELVLKELRSRGRFDPTIVIMYSTSMPLEATAEFIRLGADFALAKPNEYRIYFEDLRKILGTARLQGRG